MKRVKFALLPFVIGSSLFAGALTSDQIAKEIMSKNSGKFEITGEFAKYNFSDDEKSNWTFKLSDGSVYQLLGDTSEENIKKMGPFGWKKVDVKPSSVEYYSVNYGKGAYDWLFFKVNESGKCSEIYKLAGQNPQTKGFDYDFNKDGKIEKVDMLSCQKSGNSVTFTTFTKDSFEKILNQNETDELLKGDKLKTLTDNTKLKVVTDVTTLTNRVTVLSGLAKVTKPLNRVQNIKDVLLLNNGGEHEIIGEFAYYKFSDDEKSNWTFKAKDETVYQLLGDTSEENVKKVGPFGWKKVDVKPNKPLFYAVQFEDSKYGWLFFSVENGKCKEIYKLAGQSSSGAFLYDIDGDGKIDKIDGVSCSVKGNMVQFKESI